MNNETLNVTGTPSGRRLRAAGIAAVRVLVAVCMLNCAGELRAQTAQYAISVAADASSQHILWEINPANGALVQQSSVSMPPVNGLIYGVGGLAFGQGSLWAIGAAADAASQHLLWKIDPANGAVIQQLSVSMPPVNGLIYGVGGLAFGQGELWAISMAADNSLQHLLWEINPANGAVIQQLSVSMPPVNGLIYGVGGLAFGQGSLWAISVAADNSLQHLLWEINPSNGAVIQQLSVSMPPVNGLIYGVGGLAFGQGELWAISVAADNRLQHLLWEINPANGAVIQQLSVSMPPVNGLIYGVGGLAIKVPITVTVNRSAGQVDPASTSPINYSVVFSEPVTGFSSTGVTLTGSAPGTKVVTVTGSLSTYNVAVSGMTGSGTVTASIAAGVAEGTDSGVPNSASTSTDNTVSFAPPQGQTITFSALGNQTMGSPFALKATASSGLVVTFVSNTTAVCTVSGVNVTLVATGTCSITADQAGNAAYAAAAPVTESFRVSGKTPQTITFGALSDRSSGAAPFALSATASSGLAVSFAWTPSAVCSVSGSTVTVVGVGMCSITASQAGNANYAAANPVVRSFAVLTPQTITFVWGVLSGPVPGHLILTLGTGPLTLSATASSGLAVTFASNTTAVCTASGTTVTLVATGTCSITASQAGNATYAAAQPVTQSLTVYGEIQTISFGALSNRALGTGPFTLSATASSGLAVTFGSATTAVCTVSGATVTLVATGTCSITASQAGSATYAAAPPVTQTFTATIPVPTITSLGPSSAIAGTPAFTLTVAGTNFVTGAVVKWNGTALTTTYASATQVTASVPAASIAAAGTASLTVTTRGGTSGAASFTIIPPVPTITSLGPSSAIAGSPAFTLTVAGTNFVTGAVVKWNGTALTTMYASATQVTASVPAASIAAAGTASVTVTTSGGTSASAMYTVKTKSQTTLVLSSSSSTYGQGFAFVARVTAGAGTPPDGGMVQFFNGTAQIGAGVLSAGTAILNTITTPTGADLITAVYPGNAQIGSSTSSALSLTVSKATSSMSLNASAGPWVYGVPVTFTATVSYAGGFPPDGETVTFERGSVNLGTGKLSAGKASLTTSALPQGTWYVTAVYNGDANLAGTQETLDISVVAAAKVVLGCSVPANPGAFLSNVTWYVSMTNKGPGTAFNVRLASSTLNGLGGTVKPSTNVGSLAQGQSQVLAITGSSLNPYTQNVEKSEITWTGGSATCDISFLVNAGP